jgi:nitrogen fixation NifU-like protein
MSDLRELYQEVILDHNRHPRNYREIAGANRKSEGFNPLCGDRLTLFLQVDRDVIRDIGFVGSGCAISKASASLLTESVRGTTVEQAEALFDRVHLMLTLSPDAAEDFSDLGKLVVLAGVREFPMRVKCASLAWHTLRAALAAQGETVTTE